MVFVPVANQSYAARGTLDMVQLFGKILCFALLVVALDLVWGSAASSRWATAFFALGGYAISMNLIYATADEKLAQITDPIARDDAVKQSIFSVVGRAKTLAMVLDAGRPVLVSGGDGAGGPRAARLWLRLAGLPQPGDGVYHRSSRRRRRWRWATCSS